jgi:hypothetical protein
MCRGRLCFTGTPACRELVLKIRHPASAGPGRKPLAASVRQALNSKDKIKSLILKK